MTLADKKIALVHKILAFNKESLLDLADNAINQIQKKNTNALSDLQFYTGNVEDEVDIEKIKKEQAVKPLSMKELNALNEEADFTESIEELLKDLH